MSKISTYGNDNSPVTTDYLLGNKASGPTTSSFLISALITLFAANIMAQVKNPYKISVYRNAALNTTTSPATLVFDTKNYDTGTNYSVSTGIFTAPAAGFYLVDAAHQVSSGSNAQLDMFLVQNSTTIVTAQAGLTTSVSGQQTVSIARQVQMAAGDTLKIQIQNSVGTLGLNVGNNFTYMDISLESNT